jgi:hypothetical protein
MGRVHTKLGHWNGPPGGVGHDSGEPPYDGDMDARVARLEDFAGETRERLARVEVKLDHMGTKLDHIATDVSQFKWWALGSVLAVVLAVVGTGFSIQQMTVQTIQAAGQQVQPTQQPIIINVPSAEKPASSGR